MDKKEFVQRYILKLALTGYDLNDAGDLDAFNDYVDEAIKQYDAIEKKFEVTPTKDLWDYNDRN